MANRLNIGPDELERMQTKYRTAVQSLRTQRIMRMSEFPKLGHYLLTQEFLNYEFPRSENHWQRRSFGDYVLWKWSGNPDLMKPFGNRTTQQIVTELVEALARVGVLPVGKVPPGLRDLDREWDAKYRELFDDSAQVNKLEEECLTRRLEVQALRAKVMDLSAQRHIETVPPVIPTMISQGADSKQGGISRQDVVEFLQAIADYLEPLAEHDADMRANFRHIDDVLDSLTRVKLKIPATDAVKDFPFSDAVSRAINSWRPYVLIDDQRAAKYIATVLEGTNLTLARLIEGFVIRNGSLVTIIKSAERRGAYSRSVTKGALRALEILYTECTDRLTQKFSYFLFCRYLEKQAMKHAELFRFQQPGEAEVIYVHFAPDP